MSGLFFFFIVLFVLAAAASGLSGHDSTPGNTSHDSWKDEARKRMEQNNDDMMERFERMREDTHNQYYGPNGWAR